MHNITRWLWVALLAGIAAAACAQHPPVVPDKPQTPEPEAIVLSDTAQLLRVSMALRGTRPTLDEQRDALADPGAIARLAGEYVHSAAFGEVMRNLHNEDLLTRAAIRPDLFGFRPTQACNGCPEQCLNNCPQGCRPVCRPEEDFTPQDEYLQGLTEYEISQSVQESPLRFIEHVIMNDRPYTEIITADYTISNDITAAVWGHQDYDGSGEWRQASWADGRATAGLLSDSVLFNRHKSTANNDNRGRANMISRALLCYDFASREVEVGGVDLSDDNAVENALSTNAACVSCHQALDPIGSAFYGHFGFHPSGNTTIGYPVSIAMGPNASGKLYNSQTEGNWQFRTGRAPAFFGTPVNNVVELGAAIADDPRFSLCAAQRFYAFFHRISVDDVPLAIASELQSGFVASGYNAKQLALDIVLRDDFRELASAEGDSGLKLVTPEQISRAITDLTGLTWTATLPQEGTRNLVTDPTFGFAVLAGGIDGFATLSHAQAPNATATLFMRALSAEAAHHVVENDFAVDLASRRLLGGVNSDESSADAIKSQLVDLHLRIFGEALTIDDEEIGASHQLFDATFVRTGDVAHAWKTTLTALLQDPRMTFY